MNISKTGMLIQPKVIVYGKGRIPHLNLIAPGNKKITYRNFSSTLHLYSNTKAQCSPPNGKNMKPEMIETRKSEL